MLPKVGIFFLLDHRVLIDATSLDQAERYTHFLIHGPSHIDVWEGWRKQRVVPTDLEYDGVPRGRVHYDTIAERFTILADKCILGDPAAMAEIIERMGLPEDATRDVDAHYRCGVCLWGADRDQE